MGTATYSSWWRGRFRLGEPELALEHEQPEPHEQVLGEQRRLEPGVVGLERLKGQRAEAELL